MSMNQNSIPALPKPNRALSTWPTFTIPVAERQKINNGIFPLATLGVTSNTRLGIKKSNLQPVSTQRTGIRSQSTVHLTPPPVTMPVARGRTSGTTSTSGTPQPVVGGNTPATRGTSFPAPTQKKSASDRPGTISIRWAAFSGFALIIAFAYLPWLQTLSFVIIPSTVVAFFLAVKALREPFIKSEKTAAVWSILISISIALLDVSKLTIYH